MLEFMQRTEAEADPSWGGRWPARSVVYENPDSWGLRDAPARPVGDGTTWLDFSWDAVPPLVDLRRLVLPAARIGRSPIPDAPES